MEDTLRDYYGYEYYFACSVLILILMEDTLRVTKEKLPGMAVDVLILILMEDTLRDDMHVAIGNPCFVS